MPEGFPSYPKVYNLGHKAVKDIFDGTVYYQEKIDGSQINFKWDEHGQLHVRSKGTWQYGGPDGRVEPDGQFKPAVDHLLDVDPLGDGLIFRGEMLSKPKHNVQAYDRVPKGYIVLFDVVDSGWFPFIDDLDWYGDRLGVDYLPYRDLSGVPNHPGALDELLGSLRPLLGGDQPPEGIVFKNFDRFDLDGKPLMAKYVRAEFKEKHAEQWGESRKAGKDVIGSILDELNTPQRFQKAVQHLADRGELVGEPKDIGALMKEVSQDILDEEIEHIKDRLWEAYGKDIKRGLGRGLPEWYKQQLLEGQFQ